MEGGRIVDSRSNPLFQLIGGSQSDTQLMFYTPYSDDEEEYRKAVSSHRCCVCGSRDIMLIPLNPMQMLSKCLVCFNFKKRLDREACKAIQLSNAIFGLRANCNGYVKFEYKRRGMQ